MKQKKVLVSLLALVATFFLVGCALVGKVAMKTADFQLIQEGQMDVRNHFEYQGDKIVVMETKTTMLYSVLGVKDKKAAKTIMKAQGIEKWDNLKGVKHTVDYQSDRLVEVTSVDLTKADFKELGEVMPIQTADGKTAQYISYKLTKQNIEKLGMKEIKDGKFEELE